MVGGGGFYRGLQIYILHTTPYTYIHTSTVQGGRWEMEITQGVRFYISDTAYEPGQCVGCMDVDGWFRGGRDVRVRYIGEIGGVEGQSNHPSTQQASSPPAR